MHIVVLQVPWRTQLWAGAVEVALIWLAAVQSSGRGPTVQEAAQLLAYSMLLYSVPLAAVWWQQYKDGECTASRAGSLLNHIHERRKVGPASGSITRSSKTDVCSTSTAAAPTAQVQQSSSRHSARQEEEDSGVPQQQWQQPAAQTLSVAHVPTAAAPHRRALYTSPLQHTAMSAKVGDADKGLWFKGTQPCRWPMPGWVLA
jgi:hypothetical protein